MNPTIDTRRLVAFGVAGTVWIVGAVAGPVLSLDVPVGLVAIATYVLVGTLAAALAGRRLPLVLAGLWLGAVVLLSLIFAPIGGFLGLVVSIVYGTLACLAWMATAGAIVTFMRERHRTVSTQQ